MKFDKWLLMPIGVMVLLLVGNIVHSNSQGQALRDEQAKTKKLQSQLIDAQAQTSSKSDQGDKTATNTAQAVTVEASDAQKDGSAVVTKFLETLYESDSKNLNQRWEALKPYTTGSALEALKPVDSGDGASGDDGYKKTDIDNINSFVKSNGDSFDSLTTYDMANKIADKNTVVHMVLHATLTRDGDTWKVSKIDFNSGFEQ